jgi:NDP-sugar pyrophosphorylase family protein
VIASTQPLTLLVMAAGMGSRYGGLKQLEGFGPGGETILEYSIHDALAAGFERFVFIIRRDIEATFRDNVLARFPPRVRATVVFQDLEAGLPGALEVPPDRAKPWGTGHAVLCAREAVTGPFAVINADDFYGAEAFALLGEQLRAERQTGAYVLMAYALERTLSEHGGVARGVITHGADGTLRDVVEHTGIQRGPSGVIEARNTATHEAVRLQPQTPVSMNLWGFDPSVFALLAECFAAFHRRLEDPLKGEFYLPAAIDEAVKTGRASAQVVPTQAQWYGVTYPEDRERVRAALEGLTRQGGYPSPLWG